MLLKALDPRLGPVRRPVGPVGYCVAGSVAGPISKTDELGKSYEEYSKRYRQMPNLRTLVLKFGILGMM
jgi:hypothetical protein